MDLSISSKYIKTILVGSCVSLISLIGLENYCRRNYPESLFRPTVLIQMGTKNLTRFWTWLGFQVARCTDLYYIIREYLMEDAKNLFCAVAKLLTTPLEFTQGYYNYYTKTMTPVQYGLVSTAFIVCTLGIFLKCYLGWGIEEVKNVPGIIAGIPSYFRGKLTVL